MRSTRLWEKMTGEQIRHGLQTFLRERYSPTSHPATSIGITTLLSESFCIVQNRGICEQRVSMNVFVCFGLHLEIQRRSAHHCNVLSFE